MQQQEITDFLLDNEDFFNPIFLDVDNNCFIYKLLFKFEKCQNERGNYFTSVREIKDEILQVTFNTKDDVVLASRYDKKDLSTQGFTDYSVYFFRKGMFLLYGCLDNPSIIEENNFHIIKAQIILEPSPDYAFDVFHTLPEIIADFDPDIEGIESIEPSKEKLKKNLEHAKKKFYTRINPPVLVSKSKEDDPAKTSKVYDTMIEGRAKNELLIPDVVRNLKSLKKILDENNIPYNTPEEQERKLNDLKIVFDREKVHYLFEPSKNKK